MYSPVKILLLFSLLFAVPALAQNQKTTKMKHEDAQAGQSKRFEAKKSSTLTVAGYLAPKGDCLTKDIVASVDFQLERWVEVDNKYNLVAEKNVTLTGSLNVKFTTQSNSDGYYRVTWRPQLLQSGVKCYFNQDLDVIYVAAR
jgi:hypothetical protein